MASTRSDPNKSPKQGKSTEAIQTVEKQVRPFQAFLTKFNNDWAMNFASGLAYNLLMAMFPLVIALFAILGFILGSLNAQAYNNVKNQILHALPIPASSSVIDAALNQLNKDAGILLLIAIVLAIFNGSRLFVYIEGVFNIIYQARPRKIVRQNMVAIGMVLLFIILIPLMVFASIGPAIVFSVLAQTPLAQIPGSSFLLGLGGPLGSLLVGYILFQAIYIIVPNQKIGWRNSWRGSLVAAVLLQAFLSLFPLYVSHFLTGYAATVGFVILLIFFYYFGVILFLGAEVNAFFAEGIRTLPNDLVTTVHKVANQTTNHP